MPDFAPTHVETGEVAVTSPCVSICTVDRGLGLCMGCLRTLQEIGQWRMMSDDEKRACVARCAEREKTMPRRGRDGQPLP